MKRVLLGLAAGALALAAGPLAAGSAPAESLTAGRKLTASNVYRKDKRFGPEKATDGDAATRWATDESGELFWLDVDFGRPEQVGRVVLEECVDYGARVRAFALHLKVGDEWRTVLKRESMGKKVDEPITPVTATAARLVILGQNGPTIREFHLFPANTPPRPAG